MEIHQRENNQESEAHLQENVVKFSNQCLKLLRLFLDGHRLTTLTAPSFGVLSLPRRVLDIKENGIHVNDVWLTDSNGKRTVKEYFIEIRDEAHRRELLDFIEKHSGNQYSKPSSHPTKELIDKTKETQQFLNDLLDGKPDSPNNTFTQQSLF